MAISNLKSNKKHYRAFLTINTLTVMFIYLFTFIANNKGFTDVSGGKTLKLILFLGIFAVAIFAGIFQFYINSFLMKRRKKEYGLYSILGLEKKHISKIMLFENIYLFVISSVLGLILGIASGKGIFSLLMKLMKCDVPLESRISVTDAAVTLLIQFLVTAVVYIHNVNVLKRTRIIDMLKGSQKGNSGSKAGSIISFIAGLALVIYGCISVNRDVSVFDSINKFFISVMMILVGTFFIYEAVSRFVLSVIKKMANLYYRKNMFFPISNMLYRNKQTAAGLASICILMTVINLVMAVTVSLYTGTEQQVKDSLAYDGMAVMENAPDRNDVAEIAESAAKKTGTKLGDNISYTLFACAAINTGTEKIEFVAQKRSDDVCILNVISVSDYNQLEGKNEELGENEVLVISENSAFKGKKTISFANMQFEIKDIPSRFVLIENQAKTSTINDIYVVVNDVSDIENITKTINEYAKREKTVQLYYEFSSDGSRNEREAFENEFRKQLSEKYEVSYYDTKTEIRKESFAQNSVYLFLGFFLSILLLCLMLVVMYHKQLQEAVDDKNKYTIMRKIGCSRRQIKTMISRISSVSYFTPVVVSGIYSTVMYKTVKSVLKVFMLADTKIIVESMLFTFGAVFFIYLVGYLVTQKVYVKTVLEKD